MGIGGQHVVRANPKVISTIYTIGVGGKSEMISTISNNSTFEVGAKFEVISTISTISTIGIGGQISRLIYTIFNTIGVMAKSE